MATKHRTRLSPQHAACLAEKLNSFVKIATQSSDFPDHCLAWTIDRPNTAADFPIFLGSCRIERGERPSRGQTWLWLAVPRHNHALAGDPVEALAPLLSAAERDRAVRLRFTEDRWSYCAAHAGLRVLLGQVLQTHPADLAFATMAAGKPMLDPARHGHAACAGLHFNISHTRGMVAVAISSSPVGIDVEPVRLLPDMRALVTTLMPPEALAAYDALHDETARTELFFRYWTLGEAFIKATGLGLDQGLDSFAFTPAGVPRLTRITPGWGTPPGWTLGHARGAAEHAAL